MYEEHEWVANAFPESIRYESVIVEDENVLSPRAINAVSDVIKRANGRFHIVI